MTPSVASRPKSVISAGPCHRITSHQLQASRCSRWSCFSPSDLVTYTRSGGRWQKDSLKLRKFGTCTPNTKRFDAPVPIKSGRNEMSRYKDSSLKLQTVKSWLQGIPCHNSGINTSVGLSSSTENFPYGAGSRL